MLDTETDQFVSRFDGQATRWSMVQAAHGKTAGDEAAARQFLVMRYAPAIRAYIRGITQDDHQADDIAQDVLVRLLSGDFAGADASKGRFRDLLKTAVRNMVRNQWARQKVRQAADINDTAFEPIAEEEEESLWADGMQTRLIDLAWKRLEEYQAAHEGSLAFTVLQLRTEYPNDDSEQLAVRLGGLINRTIKADQFRQQLRRARVRFAEFLVAEVTDTLPGPTRERIEEELAALGLLEQIRDVLPADWATKK